MVPFKTLGMVALATLCCGAAQAATVTPGTITSITASCGTDGTGLSATGGPVSCSTDPSRTNTAAIELVDNIDALTLADKDFFSLGVGGYILLEFSKAITGTTFVSEETYSRIGYAESVQAYAGNTSVLADLLASTHTGTLDNTARVDSFDVALYEFKYLLLVDTSASGLYRDGYDVMALEVQWAEDNTPDVPLPAASLLLGSAMLGFGALRRRKQKAA